MTGIRRPGSPPVSPRARELDVEQNALSAVRESDSCWGMVRDVFANSPGLRAAGGSMAGIAAGVAAIELWLHPAVHEVVGHLMLGAGATLTFPEGFHPVAEINHSSGGVDFTASGARDLNTLGQYLGKDLTIAWIALAGTVPSALASTAFAATGANIAAQHPGKAAALIGFALTSMLRDATYWDNFLGHSVAQMRTTEHSDPDTFATTLHDGLRAHGYEPPHESIIGNAALATIVMLPWLGMYLGTAHALANEQRIGSDAHQKRTGVHRALGTASAAGIWTMAVQPLTHVLTKTVWSEGAAVGDAVRDAAPVYLLFHALDALWSARQAVGSDMPTSVQTLRATRLAEAVVALCACIAITLSAQDDEAANLGYPVLALAMGFLSLTVQALDTTLLRNHYNARERAQPAVNARASTSARAPAPQVTEYTSDDEGTYTYGDEGGSESDGNSGPESV